MDENVRKDVITILTQTHKFLQKPSQNLYQLRKLVNTNNHNSTIFQDESSISAAILVYCLSKVIEKAGEGIDLGRVRKLLGQTIEELEKEHVEHYQQFIAKIFSLISAADSTFKMYIKDVIREAAVVKGCRICEHGISAAKTAEILGISLWDLYDYFGTTTVAETTSDLASVRKRMDFARRLFS